MFNPSFLALVTNPTADAAGAVSEITLPNAAGHVPLFFVNNTRYDQALLNYLGSLGTDVSDPNLRPRVRLRVTLNYVNDTQNTFEFLDGSDLVQGSVLTIQGAQDNPLVPAELRANTLTSVVAICNVDSAEPGESIEVFNPAFIKVIGFEGNFLAIRVLDETIPPQFTVLERDTVDATGNTTLLQNFGIRDVPVAVPNVQCGSVVGFILTGTLRVPFVVDELGQLVPGHRTDDDAARASIPGRFEFRTVVR